MSSTKKDLAQMVGVSSSYLSQIFRSQVLLNFKTLAKIERVLAIKFRISLESEIIKSLYSEKPFPTIKYFPTEKSLSENKQNKNLAAAA